MSMSVISLDWVTASLPLPVRMHPPFVAGIAILPCDSLWRSGQRQIGLLEIVLMSLCLISSCWAVLGLVIINVSH